MGGGAGVNRLSGSVLKQVETGLSRLSWRRQEKSCGLVCRHLVLSSMCPATMQ